MPRSTDVLSDRLVLEEFPELLELLVSSKKFELRIKGFSMFPTLRTGDLVEVDPSLKEVSGGEIVVFQRGGKLICHRVIDTFENDSERWIRTQGDTLPDPDAPFAPHSLIGKVVAVERKGKRWNPARITKPSLEDTAILCLRCGIVSLRKCLLLLQRTRIFRRLTRFFFRPAVSYTIGLPLPSQNSRFWNYASPESLSFSELLPEVKKYRFFAKINGDIVGSLEVAEKDLGEWSVTHFFVRTRFRGLGIATTLLKLCLQTLRRCKAESLEAESLSDHRPAQSLFQKLGFEPLRENVSLLKKTLPSPERLLNHDKVEFLKTAARNLFLEQTLLEIEAAFREKGIEFLVQKGMALAYLIYPDPGCRPMSDIDLYLRKEDVPRAATLLKHLGYRMTEPDFQKELMTFGGELSFYRTDGTTVEFHWSLEQYERLKGIVKVCEEDLWKRAMTYPVAGRIFKTFCPEHQMLSLALHLGINHRFQGFKWFLDIDQLILKYEKEMNWQETFQMAREWGIERLLCEVLAETKALFHTPLPSLRLKKRFRLRRWNAFQWLFLDRAEDRLQFLFRIFFPSREWLIYRYRLKQKWLVSFYRLLHPLLIILGRTR